MELTIEQMFSWIADYLENNLGVQKKLLGENGFFLVDGTSEVKLNHYGIIILENTVIASWNSKKVPDLLTKSNFKTKTLTTAYPPIIIPERDGIGEAIKLTSGSVLLIVERI